MFRAKSGRDQSGRRTEKVWYKTEKSKHQGGIWMGEEVWASLGFHSNSKCFSIHSVPYKIRAFATKKVCSKWINFWSFSEFWKGNRGGEVTKIVFVAVLFFVSIFYFSNPIPELNSSTFGLALLGNCLFFFVLYQTFSVLRPNWYRPDFARNIKW